MGTEYLIWVYLGNPENVGDCCRGGDQTIVLGDHDLFENEGTEQELKVEAVYVNQIYQFSDDLVGDIALVKLR